MPMSDEVHKNLKRSYWAGIRFWVTSARVHVAGGRLDRALFSLANAHKEANLLKELRDEKSSD